ncbi:MAG: nucleoside-diphosphate sugar epimerase/dehydratase, partial [candidate division WOR-3 bacterium]
WEEARRRVAQMSFVSSSGTVLGASVKSRNGQFLEAVTRQLAQLQIALARHARIAGSRRDAFFLVGDALIAILATWMVNYLARSPVIFRPAGLLAIAVVTALLTLLANAALRNYRLAWVTFSLSDLRRLFAATTLVTIGLLFLDHLSFWHRNSPAHPLLSGIVLFLFLAAFRGSKRLLVEPIFIKPQGKRTLVVMAAKHAYFLPNVLRRLGNFDYNIVGIIDPDPNQVGSYEQGIEVVGTTDEIEAVIERYRAEVVMVMLESNPRFKLGDFYARLQRLAKVEVKTLPSLVDVIEERSDLGALEKLCIHELTGRPPLTIDVNEMRRRFGAKRILVTGAGGSIGSELCRQLARFDPAGLILFERDDSNLFSIEQEIRQLHPALELVPVLGDITRQGDLEQVFSRHRPDLVFHAAAYKHVPILEFYPADAIRVNVIGSHLLAKTALRYGAECLVYISTDKAVNPTSVMGASKRLGEMLITSMNGLGDMKTMAVRFGNVLDSRGSVTTIFRAAITKRQPITVTHREMKRYFMLTSEAVLLVLQAASLGKGGEVFVLDMGEPVPIWDLAHRMVELAGLTPNRDIPILTGKPRPGEKLFEELLTAEEGTIATENDRIYQARISRQHCYPDLLDGIQALERKLDSVENGEQLKRELQTLVPTYQPDLCLELSLSNRPFTSPSLLAINC